MRNEFTPEQIDRFWSHVDRSGGPDACWPWKRSLGTKGYGQFTTWRSGHTKTFRTNRIAFYLANGRWPEPMGLHSCDYRACCNPRHVFEGTAHDNTADAIAKGRAFVPRNPIGPTHPNAKLTQAEHDHLMSLRGVMSSSEAAALFGIAFSTVCRHWRGDLYSG